MHKTISLAAFLPSVIFPVAIFVIGLRNPSIFDAPALLKISPFPAIFYILAFSIILIFPQRSALLKENSKGLILFLLFTLGYFFMASILNKTSLNTNNIYFEADSKSWTQRMSGADGWNTGLRAVHPFIYPMFRPLVAFLSILTSGDRFYANLILLATAGGGCVFLMWKIIHWMTENQTYAILSASLLGVSTSHIIFSSAVETYIFSAFFLLFFIWLLLTNKSSYLLVIVSVATLGITITNVIQQGLAHLFVQKNLKRSIIIFSLVLGCSVCLNFIVKLVYPATDYFFIPQNLAREQQFSQGINIKRIGLVTENFFIYNITAPQPYFSIHTERPKLNFLPGTIQNYVWFGWLSLILWSTTLILTFIYFFSRDYPQKYNGLLISMSACLLFNFLLHAGYGSEPFLYTADWTYALILIIAIILQNAAKHPWFLVMWFFFVMSILINNLWVLYFIARQVGTHLV